MEYKSIRIADIIKDINREYYLPAIQRGFVWETIRIEKLFDSIMQDYPIGSFLFWKLKEEHKNDWAIYEFIRNYNEEHSHNNLANLEGINRDIYLVLDGQQRLTAFYIGLKGFYKYFRYRWKETKLFLNLLKPPIPNEDDPEELTYQFEFRESPLPTTSESELWYQVGRVLDFEDAEDAKQDIKPMISNLHEDKKDNASKLVGRLHHRINTIPVINYYEEKSQVYDKVLNIFVRANSAGKVLEYSDLLLSTATAKWEKLDAREEVNNFTDELNRIGQKYDFGKDFVLKGSLYLTEDLPIKYKVGNFTRQNLLKIEKNWVNIKAFISTTVRLVSNFGFSQKNIIAPLSLLPISFYLMKKGNESIDKSSEENDVRIQTEIRRWIIFALLKNAFGRASDTKLKNIRDILIATNLYVDFPTQLINKELDIEAKFTDSEIEEILSYNYQGRYTYLVLSLLHPERYWKDKAFHEDHIFPQSEFQIMKLRARGYDDTKIERYRSYYNTILNLELITDYENLSKSAMPFEEWIRTRDEDFKKRNHIPEMQRYDLDLFDEFIQQRKSILVDFLKNI